MSFFAKIESEKRPLLSLIHAITKQYPLVTKLVKRLTSYLPISYCVFIYVCSMDVCIFAAHLSE